MSERTRISVYRVPHPGHIEPSVWGSNDPDRDGMTLMAEWDGQKVYGVTPFRLDSELDLIGAPSPRDIYLQEDES